MGKISNLTAIKTNSKCFKFLVSFFYLVSKYSIQVNMFIPTWTLKVLLQGTCYCFPANFFYCLTPSLKHDLLSPGQLHLIPLKILHFIDKLFKSLDNGVRPLVSPLKLIIQ